MNQQNIIEFYPHIQEQFQSILFNLYRNETLQKYHSIIQQIKTKFPFPKQMPQFMYPNAEQISEFFLQNYQPIILDLPALCLKPNVKIKLYKNAVYFGEIHQEMRQGQGVLIKENKQIYEGYFALDKKDGIGFEILKGDTYYHGHYVQGYPHGEGVYMSASHQYIGQWQHGKKSGIGWCEGNKNDYFLGGWENGKFYGFGLHIYDSIYFGEVINDLKYGYGEEYFLEGDIYKGQYKNGLPNGKGKYIWKNGNQYQGDFQNGLRWGDGFWEQKTEKGIQFYKGQYVNDKKNGHGHFHYSNGTQFIGEFNEDQRHGYGEIIWPERATYKGQWKQGLMEGEGMYSYENHKLQGIWKQNQLISQEKVRVSLNQFPIQHQLKDIVEDEEIQSQVAEEPDHEKIGDNFKKISLQSKTSLCVSDTSKFPQFIQLQKQQDILIGGQTYPTQRINQTTSIGIQTEVNSTKKKLLTELPSIQTKRKNIQSSYSVDSKTKVKNKNLSESNTNTNSPNTRESEFKNNNLQQSQEKKSRKVKQRLSLLTKIEEKVLKIRLEKEKLSPYKFEKLWSKKVVNQARSLIYPPVWIPPSLHPQIKRKS
ncbi:unnamed protein product (macronuclear) [Paramecium tetraurelia]|uniref:MORN repeat protein n=1 Tax=Paramecium tetraurelia TaxID=5888 RepID=A0BKT8_PARTE|nr:uncharacterized protein GSPATT00029786001 [Paramecium tetraurelia]CAK59155.1 unnamed protein product [Paramecium tetraurelia]|eukprot:XP_001426553.1 hypothetical protein (macronuclear) [Paramecium tetraurelia strain d4-2]